MNTEDKRIPIDQFMSYPDARLVGGNPDNGTGSIRWQAMMEALDAGRIERKGLPVSPELLGEQVAIKGREPYGGDNIADVYTVTPGLVPSGAIGSSELRWNRIRTIFHNGVYMPIEMILVDLLPAGHPAITRLTNLYA